MLQRASAMQCVAVYSYTTKSYHETTPHLSQEEEREDHKVEHKAKKQAREERLHLEIQQQEMLREGEGEEDSEAGGGRKTQKAKNINKYLEGAAG